MSTIEIQATTDAKSSVALLRVAVLSGGASAEREVSLVSGRSVIEALQRCVSANSLRSVRGIEIDTNGRWILDGVAHEAASALSLSGDVDVFFLALHGGAGENGTLQGFLSACGRRHTGSGVVASAICMDKAAARGLAQANGLRVAPGRVITERAFAQDPSFELGHVRRLAIQHSAWVVKPRRGGSSVNTHAVSLASELEDAIIRVLADGDDALVEARVAGVEVSCGVLSSRTAPARALPPIEIQPDKERFFDYEQKYSGNGAREICPAPSLTPEQDRRVREASLSLHAACGCAGYSRSDFIVPPVGDPVLLEINTLPGLTPRSLLPQEAAVAGISYDELCEWIVATAGAGERA